MRCSLHTLLSISLLIMSAGSMSACSSSLKKVGAGGVCKSNTDCSGNSICRQDRCEARIDCFQDENIYAEQCPGRGCEDDSTCPGGYCDPTESKCVPGERPACTGNADCKTSVDGPFCLASVSNGEDARCVECVLTEDCPPSGGKSFNCVGNACVPVPAAGGCTKGSDCKTPALPVCNVQAKTCVECVRDGDCKANLPRCDTATFTCKAAVSTGCSDGASCVDKICDANTKECRACILGDDCGIGRTCNVGTGQCLPNVPVGECNADSDCTKKLTADGGAALPAGYNLICNKAGVTPVCVPCQINNQCTVPGTECAEFEAVYDNVKICGVVPSSETCTVATLEDDCTSDTAACVNGLCSATCSISDQCRDGQACANGQCVVEACTPGSCTGGLVCVAGACTNCTTDQQCAAGDVCQAGLCVTPNPTGNLALGSQCAADVDCASKLCREFDNISAATKFKVCTSVCTRTNSTASVVEDCPVAPPAGVARGTLAALTATKGFACAPFIGKQINGQPIDGVSLCLHSDDFDRASGSVTATADAFTKAAGVANGGSALSCQSGITIAASGYVSEVPNTNDLCSMGCGSRGDCLASGVSAFEDFTCAAELISTSRFVQNGVACPGGTCSGGATCQNGQCGNTFNYVLPSGRNACQSVEDAANNVDYNLEGRFCRQAGENFSWPGACQSSFCAGRCLTTGRPTATACTSNTQCAAGQVCDTLNQLCVASTEFPVNATACTTDNQCGAGNSCRRGKCYKSSCELAADCPANSFCMNSRCYESAAATTALCQDDFECGPNQECGGRCALFCNDRSDCTGPDSQLREKTAVVCGYWESQPTSSSSRQRICRGRLPKVGTFDHTRLRGESCQTDTDCVTEVCDNSKCTDFCGRSNVCLANETCKLREHSVSTNVFPRILSPICVPN